MVDHVLNHSEVQVASMARYIGAFAVSLALMVLGLILVTTNALSGTAALTTISALALVAVVAQSYLLFKLDTSEVRIWYTITFVMMVPLFMMAVGLTVWMFHTLALRTTLPG